MDQRTKNLLMTAAIAAVTLYIGLRIKWVATNLVQVALPASTGTV